MTTVADRLERINRYPLVRHPGTVTIEHDQTWTFVAWAAHLHDADPTNFAHLAADAEYLPRSPLADRMRAAVTAEQHRRGGERRG